MKLDKSRFEAAFAKSAEGLDDSREQDPRVQELWTLLEPTLEDRGTFEREARDHLQENTTDVRSWRSVRYFALGFSVFVVLASMITLGVMISGVDGITHLSNLGSDNVRVAFLAGSFATIFGLTALIVRGAFGSARREEGSALMPENAKIVLETIGDFIRSKS